MKSIEQLIDDALVPKPRKRSHKFSPSSFGMCFRAQFWNRKDEPKSNPPDARTLRVFECGKIFEQFVKNLILEPGNDWIDCGEDPIECEDIKGFADLESENEIADVKSQHSKAFWYINKYKSNDIIQAKYNNWLQVMYYARERKKQFGRLVFISKDDLAIKEYVQPLNSFWLKEIETELVALRYLWLKDELPEAKPRCKPTAKGTYWHCDWCNFLDLCQETEKNNKRS